MGIAIVGIGLPGVGKTTILKRLAGNTTAYVCPDDIRLALTGDASDQSRNQEVWEEAYRQIHAELDAGHNVIVDATNARKADRLRLIAHCRLKADEIQGIWFVAPLSVVQTRNQKRNRTVPDTIIEAMAHQLEADPPTLTDGFDQLIKVDTTR